MPDTDLGQFVSMMSADERRQLAELLTDDSGPNRICTQRFRLTEVERDRLQRWADKMTGGNVSKFVRDSLPLDREP